jgi:hypothetical protein
MFLCLAVPLPAISTTIPWQAEFCGLAWKGSVGVSLYKIIVVGGWCGNRMIIVAEHLANRLEIAGYSCRLKHHSVWENPAPPVGGDLVLQLLPAFTEAETGCPVINIKPMLVDLDHSQTLTRILERVRLDYPLQASLPAVSTSKRRLAVEAA